MCVCKEATQRDEDRVLRFERRARERSPVRASLMAAQRLGDGSTRLRAVHLTDLSARGAGARGPAGFEPGARVRLYADGRTTPFALARIVRSGPQGPDADQHRLGLEFVPPSAQAV